MLNQNKKEPLKNPRSAVSPDSFKPANLYNSGPDSTPYSSLTDKSTHKPGQSLAQWAASTAAAKPEYADSKTNYTASATISSASGVKSSTTASSKDDGSSFHSKATLATPLASNDSAKSQPGCCERLSACIFWALSCGTYSTASNSQSLAHN